MRKKFIIVPVDGATNIKLEVLDFNTLTTVHTDNTISPTKEVKGLKYNCTADEFKWFDRCIRALPDELKNIAVISPVARGASGGLVGLDNTLIEVPGGGLTLAYTQEYPERVENRFNELAGTKKEFFLETGSIRDFPGSLTLTKRLVFEELERPALLKNAAGFGTYGILMSGHFLGDDFLKAVRTAGNEHSYWMAHTGARNINETPGTPSRLAEKIESFWRLIPKESSVSYKGIGNMPHNQADSLKLSEEILVVSGGHDTCLSHIPVMSTFYQVFPENAGKPVIHIDGGTWTMIAQIGGALTLPENGYERDIIVQGTIDGEPVVTARYGGGSDFRYIKSLMEKRGQIFGGQLDVKLLEKVVKDADCFVLPNIHPNNYKTGPFPDLKGRIINEDTFYRYPDRAHIIANLTTAVTTEHQITSIIKDSEIPIVLTAGGSTDPYFGRLLAALTARKVYAMFDKDGNAVSETTTLGAAIVGKAACLNMHPYQVDVSSLGILYREYKPFEGKIAEQIKHYRENLMKEIGKWKSK